MVGLEPSPLPSAKDTIPQSSNTGKCVIAPLEALMVPIVMMRHLGIGKPLLKRIGNVEPARNARVLFETLKDSKDAREPEGRLIEGNQNLSIHVSNDRVEKVIKPVILVGVATERVFGPVVDGVDVFPEVGHDMKGSMGPVHAEAHDVVVEDKADESFLERLGFDICGGTSSRGIVARKDEIEAKIEHKL